MRELLLLLHYLLLQIVDGISTALLLLNRLLLLHVELIAAEGQTEVEEERKDPCGDGVVDNGVENEIEHCVLLDPLKKSLERACVRLELRGRRVGGGRVSREKCCASRALAPTDYDSIVEYVVSSQTESSTT